jgi:hypothetical protein
LAKIKKERETERNADEQGGENRQPNVRDREAPDLGRDENKKDDRGNNDVEAEERADPGREQFLEKKREIQTVFQDPREKFPIRENDAEDTEKEVNVAQAHGL